MGLFGISWGPLRALSEAAWGPLGGACWELLLGLLGPPSPSLGPPGRPPGPPWAPLDPSGEQDPYKKFNINGKKLPKEKYVYQILTDTGMFCINGIKVGDYNTGIEKYLSDHELKYSFFEE